VDARCVGERTDDVAEIGTRRDQRIEHVARSFRRNGHQQAARGLRIAEKKRESERKTGVETGTALEGIVEIRARSPRYDVERGKLQRFRQESNTARIDARA
jgi:hypothetical protein